TFSLYISPQHYLRNSAWLESGSKEDDLEAIVVLRFHVGDFFQCSLELFPIEELGTGLDVLTAGKPICEHCGHELFNGDVVLGCKLSGALVQILGYGDALAHVPSSSIVFKN